MKAVKIAVLMLFLVTSGLHAQNCKDGLVSVLSRKNDIFYFKICKDFIGSCVEVYSPEGQVLVSEDMISLKALVDFYFEKPGKYVIKFTKDKVEKEFEFTKETPPPLAAAHLDYQIVISQQ